MGCRESTNIMARLWQSRLSTSWATCDRRKSRWESLRWVQAGTGIFVDNWPHTRPCCHAPCSSGPDHELGVTGSGESQTWEHRQAAGHRGGAGGAGQGEVIELFVCYHVMMIDWLFPNNVWTFNNGIAMQWQCVFSQIHAKCKMMWNQHLLPLVMK